MERSMAKKQTVDRAAGGSPKLVHSHGEQLLDMAKREKLHAPTSPASCG
jgi:hypothetical protein